MSWFFSYWKIAVETFCVVRRVNATEEFQRWVGEKLGHSRIEANDARSGPEVGEGSCSHGPALAPGPYDRRNV